MLARNQPPVVRVYGYGWRFDPKRWWTVNVYVAVKWTWIAFAVFWLLAAFVQKRSIRRQSASSRLFQVAIMVVALAPLFLASRRTHLLSRHLFPTPPWVQSIGVLTMLAGLGFAVWARLALGGNWSGTVTVKENHTLITRGPYRWVRHPIYTGILLTLVGNAVIGGRVVYVLALGAVTLGFWLKLRIEEKFMLETFGEQYRDYRGRVKALVPYVM